MTNPNEREIENLTLLLREIDAIMYRVEYMNGVSAVCDLLHERANEILDEINALLVNAD